MKSKYISVIQSKFTKTNPNFFQNRGGGAPGAPVLGPPLLSSHIENKQDIRVGQNRFIITGYSLLDRDPSISVTAYLAITK